MHIKNERKCIACRNHALKHDLLRISNLNGKIIINDDKKICGRGVYVCPKSDCIDLVIKKKLLNRAFKCPISDDVYEELRGYIVES